MPQVKLMIISYNYYVYKCNYLLFFFSFVSNFLRSFKFSILVSVIIYICLIILFVVNLFCAHNTSIIYPFVVIWHVEMRIASWDYLKLVKHNKKCKHARHYKLL